MRRRLRRRMKNRVRAARSGMGHQVVYGFKRPSHLFYHCMTTCASHKIWHQLSLSIRTISPSDAQVGCPPFTGLPGRIQSCHSRLDTPISLGFAVDFGTVKSPVNMS